MPKADMAPKESSPQNSSMLSKDGIKDELEQIRHEIAVMNNIMTMCLETTKTLQEQLQCVKESIQMLMAKMDNLLSQ